MINIQPYGVYDSIKKTFVKTFRVIGILLVFLGTGNVSASTAYSQNTLLSLEVKNATMKDVFRTIEKSSEYIFFYSDEINVNRKVVLNVNNQTIDEIMNQVLKNTGYTYVVSDRQVFVKKDATAAINNTAEKEAVEQNKTIQGTIVDKNGEPIIGANVVLKGSTIGTITDFDGKFTLSVPANSAILVISYIGYVKQEVPAQGTQLDIVLVEDSELMDEVVIVGYGVQKKVNLTGSIATVSSEDLVGRTNTNLLQSLQGTAPGVTIISRPGKTPEINVRGRGNLKTSEPLYVIDGAISTAVSFSNLDPNSIETVSILKDAASSAIYGSRAAYGVVLVTTKQGSKEGLRINYDGYVSMKQQTTKPKVVSSEWEARLINEAAKNAGQTTQPVSDDIIELYRNGSQPDLYPNTDWYDLIFDNHALMTSHTVSFNGTTGNGATSYYASLGYTYDDAFQPGQSTDRYNVNLNLSSQLKPWLKLRAGVKYIESVLDKSTGNIAISHLMQSSPSYVARQSTGEYGTVQGGANASSTFVTRNPLRKLEQGGWTKRNQKTTIFDGAIDLTLAKGLVLTGQMISDNYDYKNKKYDSFMPGVPRFLDEGKTSVGAVKQSESKMEYDWYERCRMTYNALLNYGWSKDSHNVNVLLGSSYETYNYQQQKSYRKNFPTNTIEGMNGGSSSPSDSHTEGAMTEEKMMSYFGRVNYNYMERYLFEANIRADATSRFHKDERWGYFPSFSAGWRISEEPFMKQITWIDNLKLRASWGQLGNINNVNEYDYFAAYGVGNAWPNDYRYSIGGTPITSIYESRIPNKMLTWEKVTMTDIGLDATLLGNKLVMTLDWYLKKTDKILLEYDVLREVGSANKVSQNLGKVENKGLELALTHNNTINGISYSVSANIAKNWNKITYLGEGVANMAPDKDYGYIEAVGQAMGTFYGYKTDGLLTAEDIASGNYISDGTKVQPGDVKYVDMDDSGTLTPEDRTFLGKEVPDFTYGGSISVSYKNFDLGIFGQGISGAKVYLKMENAHPFADNAPPREWHKKRWTEENPNPRAAYPRLLPQGNANYKFNTKDFSDFWLFSADYFRVKNITLGYTLSQKLVRTIGLTNLRLYVSSENPFTIRGDKRMKDYDPETATGRGALVTGVRSYIFGVNVAF